MLSLLLDAFLAHQRRERAILEGMAADAAAGDTDAAAATAAGARARAPSEAALREQARKVRLLRESSTFFRRVASETLGVEAETLGVELEGDARPAAAPPRPGADEDGDVELGTVGGGGGGGGAALLGEDEGLCSICIAEARNATLLPCGHGGICFDCGKRLVAMRSRCPLCRASIDEVLRYDESLTFTNADGKEVVVSDMSAART